MDTLLEEVLVAMPLSWPEAMILRPIGGEAAQVITQELRGRYRLHLQVQGALSVWPKEVEGEALVFQARLPRAVLLASGGVNSLTAEILGMLKEFARRLGKVS